jgi:hypothetical protein
VSGLHAVAVDVPEPVAASELAVVSDLDPAVVRALALEAESAQPAPDGSSERAGGQDVRPRD